MKTNLALLGIIVLAALKSSDSQARDSYTHGYTRSNGTQVQGYHHTTTDNTVNNNYGTQGNVNPYTGSYGTRERNPYQPQGQYNQGNGMGYQRRSNGDNNE